MESHSHSHSRTHTHNQTQTYLPSPTSSSTNSNATNNVIFSTTPKHQQTQVTRSESNPYPTTFVQADTSSFKQVVQMLTGSSDSSTKSPKQANPIPPIKTPTKSKLYERRSATLKNLRLTKLNPSSLSSPQTGERERGEALSPSLLDFPSLVLSPVTPLIHDPFLRSPISSNSSPNVVVDKFAEDKAIAEKGFFLHPSPVSTPRDSEPRLLTLFPLSSPRVSSSGSNQPTS